MNERGPDFQNQYGPMLISSNFYLTFAVSVLALRGFKQPQPFIDEHGNVLLYNGEIYQGDFQVREEKKRKKNESFFVFKDKTR